jgi:hypothetical protein
MAHPAPSSEAAAKPQGTPSAPDLRDVFVSVFTCGGCGGEQFKVEPVIPPVCCGYPMCWCFDIRGDLV